MWDEVQDEGEASNEDKDQTQDKGNKRAKWNALRSSSQVIPSPPPYQLSPSLHRLVKFLPLRLQLQKAILSSIFLGFSIFCTTITMAFVHGRVPDQQQYRPLPDLFLDNIKHIEWAFLLTEMTGLFLFFLYLMVFLFHRYRFIMLWRVNIILGTVLLLRCITMLLTSMSVPGAHIKCSSSDIGVTLEEKLNHAWRIVTGLGEYSVLV